MNALRLQNITYSYEEDKILDKFNLEVKKGHNICICASDSMGKSTLAKLFKYKIKYLGSYYINEVEVVKANSYIIDNFVNVVTFDNNLENKKVVDLLFDAFKDLDEENQTKEVNKIIRYFKIKDSLTFKYNELSIENKYYLYLIINLLCKDKYLVIDNILCYLRKSMIDKIYSYAKKNKVTIINITANLEEVFYSEYMICLYHGKIAMEGDIISCLKEERLLKRLGFKLPFMYDLSLQLNYYEVIDGIYLDEDEMISKIWN